MRPDFVLAEHPPLALVPQVIFGYGTPVKGFDISQSEEFGYKDSAFLAVGNKIVRADAKSGESKDFIRLVNPSTCLFSRDGKSLYILELGVKAETNGGILYRVTRDSQTGRR
jgi:hypothetical protein